MYTSFAYQKIQNDNYLNHLNHQHSAISTTYLLIFKKSINSDLVLIINKTDNLDFS